MENRIKREGETRIVNNAREAFDVVSGELFDIGVKLQMARVISENLRQDFFWCSGEYYEEHTSEMLMEYEAAEVFSYVVNDYLRDAGEMLKSLQEHIGTLQKQIDSKTEQESKKPGTRQGSTMDKQELREYILRFVNQIENEEQLNRILNMAQKYYVRQDMPEGVVGPSDLSRKRSRLSALAYSAEDPEKIRCAAVFLEAATR